MAYKEHLLMAYLKCIELKCRKFGRVLRECYFTLLKNTQFNDIINVTKKG